MPVIGVGTGQALYWISLPRGDIGRGGDSVVTARTLGLGVSGGLFAYLVNGGITQITVTNVWDLPSGTLHIAKPDGPARPGVPVEDQAAYTTLSRNLVAPFCEIAAILSRRTPARGP
jgi:hypothetical protein